MAARERPSRAEPRPPERVFVPPEVSFFELAPGPGIAPFWKGIATLLGFAPKQPVADGPVGLTMMRHAKLRRAAFRIVPWGVITAVAHGWDEIDQIVHESLKQQDGTNDRGWPFIKSFVYVDIDGERFQGVCDLKPALSGLPGLLRTFAAESERPIALDLDGEEATDPRTGVAFRRLLDAARRLRASPRGAELFDVRSSDYRTTTRSLRDDGRAMLRGLMSRAPGAIDLAPFATVLAAELGEEGFEAELSILARSPCPLVAAIARAAAMRVGSGPSSFARRRELSAFLEAAEAHAIDAWARGD